MRTGRIIVYALLSLMAVLFIIALSHLNEVNFSDIFARLIAFIAIVPILVVLRKHLHL